MYRTDAYTNTGKFQSAIAIDHRAKVIDYARALLTKIEFELIEEKPSEIVLRQYSDTIISALSVAFYNEG